MATKQWLFRLDFDVPCGGAVPSKNTIKRVLNEIEINWKTQICTQSRRIEDVCAYVLLSPKPGQNIQWCFNELYGKSSITRMTSLSTVRAAIIYLPRISLINLTAFYYTTQIQA